MSNQIPEHVEHARHASRRASSHAGSEDQDPAYAVDQDPAYGVCLLATAYFVASPPSTITFSTTPAPLRLKAAAAWYSGDSKQATPCSRVGNSITTNRWKSCGPSLIL